MAEQEKLYGLTAESIQLIVSNTVKKLIDGGFIPATRTDFSKFDVIDKKLQNNISDAYDPTSTYSKGQIYIHDNELYVCNTDIDTPEQFDPNKWDRTNLGEILLNVQKRMNMMLSGYVNMDYVNPTVMSPTSYFVFNEESGMITGLTDEGKAATDIVIPPIINGVVVTGIGENGFRDCSNIRSVIIPNGVTKIGMCAFQDCINLSSINIPNRLVSIERGLFYNCSSLKTILIPCVKSIDWDGFNQCSGLEKVTVLYGVTEIGLLAFYKCTSLKSIIIPDTVTSIANEAFLDCSALTDIYFGGTETQWNAITIGASNTALINATKHYNYKI